MATPVVVSRIQNRRGTQSQFDTLYPVGYQGIGGYGDPSWPGFDSTNYPNVLMPGELALCTDSRNVFLGNSNGEYIKLSTINTSGIQLTPLTISLPPVGVPTVIPELTYAVTNFFTLLYDLTDAPPDIPPPGTAPGVVGPSFSSNGELKITAIASPPVPPLPVTLVDTSVEINLNPSYNIGFSAKYDNDLGPSNIQICYQHNFPTPLIFSTSTIQWI